MHPATLHPQLQPRTPKDTLPIPVSKKKPFAMSEVLDLYLHVLSQMYLLKSEQLTRRLYKMGMLTTVQARLKQLVDAGYVHCFQLPTIKSRSPYLYALSTKGAKYLEKYHEITVDVVYKPSEQKELSHPYLWHLLELNDFLILTHTLEKAHPDYQLESFWHDFSMKKKPMHVPHGETKNETGEPGIRFVDVWPDAFVAIRMEQAEKKPLQYCYWIELDRGTEQTEKRFKEKIRRIVAAIKTGKAQEYFTMNHIAGVLFATTAGVKRVEQMQRWTMQVLASLHAKPELVTLFLFAPFHASMTHTQVFFDPLWVTPLKEQKPRSLLGQ